MTTLKFNTSVLPQLSTVKAKIVADYSALHRDLSIIKNQTDKIITLSQSDFKYGTVIINENSYVRSVGSAVVESVMDTKGYVFKLIENVTFDPMNLDPQNVSISNVATIGKPSFSHGFGSLYPFDQYGIGFFTALAVSAKDITIDLNGFTLQQSSSHKLTQRFYSNIELSNQPFIPGVGPHSFGGSFKAANRVLVCNGILAQSAHHGIHGNNQRNIIIENVDFVNYEVSAMSLNGGSNITTHKCQMLGSDQAIPTVGIFSALTFVEPYVSFLALDPTKNITCWNSDTVNVDTFLASDIKTRVLADLWAVYDAVINGVGTIVNTQYHNFVGSVDGNGYGLSFNKEKPTVGPFPSSRSGVPCKSIYIKDCTLSNHVSWVNEIPALVSPDFSRAMNDQTGAIIQTDTNWQVLESAGPNMGAFDIHRAITPVAQFLTAKYRNAFPPHLNTARSSIGPTDVALMEAGGSFLGYHKLWNGDSMRHTNKGVVVLKVDACEDILVQNVKIENSANVTPVLGRFYNDDQYDNSLTSSHVVTDAEYLYKSRLGTDAGSSINGSQASDIRAVSLASSNNIIFEGLNISNTSSVKGRAIGIDAFFETTNLHVSSSQIYNVIGSKDVSLNDISVNTNPIQLNDAIGVHVGKDVKFVSLDIEVNGTVSGLTGSDPFRID